MHSARWSLKMDFIVYTPKSWLINSSNNHDSSNYFPIKSSSTSKATESKDSLKLNSTNQARSNRLYLNISFCTFYALIPHVADKGPPSLSNRISNRKCTILNYLFKRKDNQLLEVSKRQQYVITTTIKVENKPKKIWQNKVPLLTQTTAEHEPYCCMHDHNSQEPNQKKLRYHANKRFFYQIYQKYNCQLMWDNNMNH